MRAGEAAGPQSGEAGRGTAPRLPVTQLLGTKWPSSSCTEARLLRSPVSTRAACLWQGDKLRNTKLTKNFLIVGECQSRVWSGAQNAEDFGQWIRVV